MHNKLLKTLLALGLLAPFAYSYAQVDAGALQQNLERQLPGASPLNLPEPTRPAPVKPVERQESLARFKVTSFQLEGVQLIGESEVQDILKPWLGQTLNFQDLERACDAIITLYLKHGYTVRAVVPPQKVTDGVVRITVTESRLSSVVVNSAQSQNRFSKERVKQYFTDANPIGDPLRLDAIDRAGAILNETPGVVVSSQLEAGEAKGDTVLSVDLNESKLFGGRVEANNYGSRTTGANQGVVSLGLINPSGFGDQATVNGIYSEGLQYVQGLYSFPVSTDGLRFGLSGTYLEYKNVSNYVNPNGGTGDAWTGGLSAAYPLIRSQSTNLNANINYDVKSYMNKNLITNAVISSYGINNTTLGLSGNRIDGLGHGGVTNGSLAVVFGNLTINATTPGAGAPSGYGYYTPSSFTKFNFATSRNQRLVSNGSTSLFVGVNGQLSSANLNSAEQFYLGGPYGVRAYPVAQSPGAQGGIATAELRQQLPKQVILSGFFDYGLVQQYKNLYPGWQGLTNANNTYSLKGAGLGLRWSYQGWNLGAIVAWKVGSNPLYNQNGQAVNTDGTNTQPRGWLTGSFVF